MESAALDPRVLHEWVADDPEYVHGVKYRLRERGEGERSLGWGDYALEVWGYLEGFEEVYGHPEDDWAKTEDGRHVALEWMLCLSELGWNIGRLAAECARLADLNRQYELLVMPVPEAVNEVSQ